MLRTLPSIIVSVFFILETVHSANLDDWQYKIIAETNDQYQSFNHQPVISCSGDVAFVANTVEGSGIYKATGEHIFQLHHHSNDMKAYRMPYITANGDVIFLFAPKGDSVLYKSNGKELKTIFGGAGQKKAYSFAVNKQGTIAYSGTYQINNSKLQRNSRRSQNALFVFDGRQSKLIIENPERLFKEYGSNGFTINDNGQVVFLGTRLDHKKRGIYVASLNGVLPISDNFTDIDMYFNPLINNAGDIAVNGHIKIDERRSMPGLYLIKDGAITKIGGDAYKIVSGNMSINDAGGMVFTARRHQDKDKKGIFFGPNPIKHKILAPGDHIENRQVENVFISNTALNNKGQVVMQVRFNNDSDAIVIATPSTSEMPQTSCPRNISGKTLIANIEEKKESENTQSVASEQTSTQLVKTIPFAMLQDKTRESEWIKREKHRYEKILAAGNYNTLVIPFLPDGDTLDAPGRTMLARMLAGQLIQRDKSMKIPDPGLVEKALGQPLRYVKLEKIFWLAKKLKVNRVFIGYVGHNRNYKLHVSLDVFYEKKGQVNESSAHQHYVAKELEFSDTHLPYMAFKPIANQWVTKISSKKKIATALESKKLKSYAELPVSLTELITRSKQSSIEQARQLVFLGTLFPWSVESRARDHLFERTLMTLERVHPESPGYRLLKSHALIALGRRPASIQALGRARTSTEKAQHAYLNSNLSAMDKYIPSIEDKTMQLIAILNRAHLSNKFGFPGEFIGSKEITEIINKYKIWSTLVLQRLLDKKEKGQMSNFLTKILLDKLQPNVAPSAAEISVGKIVEALTLQKQNNIELAMAKAVMNHIKNSFSVTKEHNVIHTNTTMPRHYDLLELASDLTLAFVLTKSRSYAPDRSINFLDSYAGLFSTNPQFALEQGSAYMMSSLQEGNQISDRLFAESFIWNPVQHSFSDVISLRLPKFFPLLNDVSKEIREQALFIHDFPTRYFSFYNMNPKDVIKRQKLARLCLEYTLHQIHCVKELQTTTKNDQNNEMASAKMLLQTLEKRFIGNPERDELIVWLRQKTGKDYTEIAAMQKSIKSGSTSWEPYQVVGLHLAKKGDYKSALEVYLKYPGFISKSLVDRNQKSNLAYEAGSELFWRGAWKEAISLYQISAKLETGTNASLAAASRLALIEKDWDKAMKISLIRATRYNNRYAYRDYISLLHFTGNSQMAWSLFDQKQDNPGGPQLWTSAYMGHRIQNAGIESIIEWATDIRRGFTGEIRSKEVPLQMRYIVLASIIDRQVPSDLAGKLLELYPAAKWHTGDFSHLPPGLSSEQLEEIKSYELTAYIGPQMLVRSAEALIAFKKGNYARTYDLLNSMGSLEDLKEFLPYYTLAAVKLNKLDRIKNYLAQSQKRYTQLLDPNKTIERQHNNIIGMEYYDNLSNALLKGFEGLHKESLQHLNRALNYRPFTVNSSIFTYYQLLEVAEWMYENNSEKSYRDFIYRQAKRFTIIQPMYPWAYAFTAKMAPSHEERIKETAILLSLDPGSLRLSEMSEADRTSARDWLKKHGNPYENQKQLIKDKPLIMSSSNSEFLKYNSVHSYLIH